MSLPWVRRWPAWAIAFLGACALLRIAFGALDHDAILYLHLSWQVFSGRRLYVDTFDHHLPTFAYLLAPLHALTEDPPTLVWLGRAANGVVLAGLGLVTHRLGLAVGGPSLAALGVVLMLSDARRVEVATEVRAQPLALLCVMAATLVLSGGGRGRPRACALAGVLGTLGCTLFPQCALGALALIPAVVAAGDEHGPSSPPRAGLVRLAAYAGGALAVGGVFVGWLIAEGWLEAFEDLCVRYNRALYGYLTFRPRDLVGMVLSDAHIWVLGVVGVVAGVPGREARLLVVIPAVAHLAVLLAVRAPYLQYWLVVWPSMALMAAWAFLALASHKSPQGPRVRPWGTALLVAFLCVSALPRLLRDLRWDGGSTWVWFAEVSRRVVRNTPPGEPVFDPGFWFNVARPDVDYFWQGHEHYYRALSDLRGRPVRPDWPGAIRRARPRYVSDVALGAADRAFLSRGYVPTSHPFLWVAGARLDAARAGGHTVELVTPGPYRLEPAWVKRHVAIDGLRPGAGPIWLRAGPHRVEALSDGLGPLVLRLDEAM